MRSDVDRWWIGPVDGAALVEVRSGSLAELVGIAFDARPVDGAAPAEVLVLDDPDGSTVEVVDDTTQGAEPIGDATAPSARPFRRSGLEHPAEVLRAVSDAVEHIVAARSTTPVIHCGLVVSAETDPRAALVVGASHAGKSTLTVQSTAAGLRFGTDELTGISDRPQVDAFTRPAHLRHGGPDLPDGWTRYDSSIGDVAVPDVWGAPLPTAALIVVLDRRQESDVEPTVTPVSRAQAARLLVEQGYNVVNLGEDGIGVVARFAARVPAVTLTYSDSRTAAHTLAAALAGATPTHGEDVGPAQSVPVAGRADLRVWVLDGSALVTDAASTWVAAVDGDVELTDDGEAVLHPAVVDQIDELSRQTPPSAAR